MKRQQGRRRYVFRLDVTYPPGSRVAGWMPPNWRDLLREGWGNLLLTREHAMAKADLLRRAGALVNVVRSLPVVWPDDTPAEVRAAPKHPDTPLAGLENLR